MRIACLLVALLLCTAVVQAGSLDLPRNHYPLVVSDWISISYDPNGGGGGNGLFTASGFTNVVEMTAEDTHPAHFGSFELTAVIDPNTGQQKGGSLFLTELDDYGDPTTLFSSSSILNFGFSAEDLFEFTFQQESGTLAPLGATVGVILDGRQISEFSEPRFDISFSGDGSATSDTFYLPEPASASLLILGGLGLLRRKQA